MSKTIEIFIVEDEVVIAHDIKGALDDIGYNVVGIASDYESAIKVFDYEKPDLLLLDITLKGSKTGIDLAHYVRENFSIPFIFITSHANTSTIEKAKVTRPNGYLVKPFNQDDLHAAIEVALFNFNDNQEIAPKNAESISPKNAFKDSVFVKHSGLFQRIRYSNIEYLEADGAYTNIITSDKKKYADRKVLLEFEKGLPHEVFMRVHRSYIVNLNHVQGIKIDSVVLSNGQVPLGRTHKEKLLKIL